MITLTNEQKARIFAMYLGCRLLAGKGTYLDLTVQRLSRILDAHFTLEGKGMSGYKLLLAPLSAITDEDAIEVANMITKRVYNNASAAKRCVNFHTAIGFMHYACTYLIQSGYAVPLFIEPNHPNNGKTAIEMGIAIDKTTL